MNLIYKKAGTKDIEILTKTRIQVLKAANSLCEDADLTAVEKESRAYYEKALKDKSHAAYLVYDGEKIAGAGGVSFYQVMPTVHNSTGWKAYIMNMYTHPSYRRKGIALHMLDLLVTEARKRGMNHITLEATQMGRPLYETYGFIPMENEMELPEEKERQ